MSIEIPIYALFGRLISENSRILLSKFFFFRTFCNINMSQNFC